MSDERADPRSPGFRGNSIYTKHLRHRYMYGTEYINKDSVVLDVPCGVGWGTSMLTHITSNLYGLDRCSEAVEYGKSQWSPPIKFVVGDMLSMPYTPDFFDTIICVEGYEHVSKNNQLILLKELNRILKSNGVLILSTPIDTHNKQSGNPYHLHEPSEAEFLHRVSTYFKITASEYYQLPDLKHLIITAKKIKKS